MADRSSWIPGSRTQDRDAVGLARLGGALLMVVSLVVIPAALALDPVPPLEQFLLPAFGLVLASIYLLAPASRITRAWIPVLIALSVLLTAVEAHVISDDVAFYFVVDAVFAALALPTRRQLVIFTAALSLLLFASLVYSDDAHDQLHHVLITLPVLFISLFLVRYLRETLETRERTYRDFASEAVTLAQRIRRGSGVGPGGLPEEDERRLEEIAARTGAGERAGPRARSGSP